VIWSDGQERPLGPAERAQLLQLTNSYAGQGLRVLAVARRRLEPSAPVPEVREQAERSLCFLGLVAMSDPPRAEVAAAVAACHEAGIRIIVITGDNGLTAAAIAHRVGIAGENPTIITGEQLDRLSEPELDSLLREHRELSSRAAHPRPSCGSPTRCAPRGTSSR
jgi:magnesium-transporting ATPase (P-type)